MAHGEIKRGRCETSERAHVCARDAQSRKYCRPYRVASREPARIFINAGAGARALPSGVAPVSLLSLSLSTDRCVRGGLKLGWYVPRVLICRSITVPVECSIRDFRLIAARGWATLTCRPLYGLSLNSSLARPDSRCRCTRVTPRALQRLPLFLGAMYVPRIVRTL